MKLKIVIVNNLRGEPTPQVWHAEKRDDYYSRKIKALGDTLVSEGDMTPEETELYLKGTPLEAIFQTRLHNVQRATNDGPV